MSPNRPNYHAAILLWWLALLPAAPVANAAEALEDHFRQAWYYTEIIVFQRPAVQDHLTDERLTGLPTPLGRTLYAFRSDAPLWSAYDLYPATRAYLTFPHLELLPEAEAEDEVQAQPRPQGTPAPGIEPRLAADPLLDFLAQVADFERALDRRSYQWLEPDPFTLTGPARRLANSRSQRVLLHGRWLQPVPERGAPQPLLIHAGRRLPDQHGAHELEGTMEVTLGRYLHFRTQLVYREPLLGREPVEAARSPDTPAPPLGQTLSREALESAGVMQILESRRLRSGELHYLDHPKLGVLVRIEPVTPPESLSAAYLVLEELDE
ncbi:MAG: CsiV family protein [Gammaproteobacteria bacterium]|nr:CsiV family protein [Gammaproteobacteria bacterium]